MNEQSAGEGDAAKTVENALQGTRPGVAMQCMIAVDRGRPEPARLDPFGNSSNSLFTGMRGTGTILKGD
jgi:hypothetical protein